ncbi:MAG: phage tail tape measure protein [Streptosporangiaceae bacterium]|nr:phage tail tape measure protein [Streptosporangiaceae bacterium]
MVPVSESIADLYIEFRAITEPAIAGFAKLAAAGEGLAAKIDASLAAIDTATKGLGAGMTAAAAQFTAAANEIVAANQRAAESFKAVTDAATASATAAASAEESLAAKIAADEEKISAAQTAARDKAIAGYEREAAAQAAMANKMAADQVKMEAATTKAAAAVDATGLAMAGMSTKMSTASVAGATFSSKMSDVAGKVGLTSGQLGLLGVAAAGVGYETVKMASTFDQQMELIATQAHAPQAEVDNLKQKVLELAPAVGIGPDKLAEALYHLESVGLRGDQAMTALAASAKGAQIGIADLDTVAYAMSGVMSVGMKDVQGYADGVAFLNTIVGQGDMKMQDLAKAIGTGVLPAFKDAGLGMKDFGAALTTLTDNSVPAEVAANHLKTSVQLLQNQSGPAKKALAELGIGAGQLGKDLEQGGLQQALIDVQSHMENFTPAGGKVRLSLEQVQTASKRFYDSLIQDGATTDEATKATARYTDGLNKNGSAAQQAGALLSKAFGGARSAATMETLTGEAARFTGKLRDMGTAEQRAAQLQADWAHTQEQLKVKMAEAKEGVASLAIQIGNVLMPAFSAIAGVIGTATTWMAEHKAVAIALAVVIGAVLLFAIAAVTVALYAMVAAVVAVEVAGAPLILIVLGIMAVLALLAGAAYLIIHNWSSISAFFSGLWNGVKSIFNSAVSWVVDKIHAMAAGIESAWAKIKAFFSQSPQQIASQIGQFFGHIVGLAIVGMVKFVAAIGKGVLAAMQWFHELPGKIQAALQDAASWLAKAAVDMFHGFLQWLTTTWTGTVQPWLKSLPEKIKTFFADAPSWLMQAGSDILNGLLNGLKSVLSAVWAFLKGFVTQVIQTVKSGLGISSPSTIFLQIGVDLLTGFLNGLKNTWNSVLSFFQALPGKIKGFFSGAASWLVEAGKAILNGLLNGLKSAWGAVQSFVSGIGSWISSHKGPIEVDAVLLVPHGTAIMGGLDRGMQDRFERTKEWVRDVHHQLAGAMGQGGLGGAGSVSGSPGLSSSAGLQIVAPILTGIGASSSAGASGAASKNEFHFHVQGNIWTADDLVREMQQALQRHGMRNTSSGVNYGFR